MEDKLYAVSGGVSGGLFQSQAIGNSFYKETYIRVKLTLLLTDERCRLREPLPSLPLARLPTSYSPRFLISIGKSVFKSPLIVDICTSASRFDGNFTSTLPLTDE